MEKAYDLGALAAKAKEHGLEALEQNTELAVKIVIEWFKESAKKSATPYDDMALIVLPQVEAFIASAVNKIDGKEG